MAIIDSVPAPVLFNGLKHHTGYIQAFIRECIVHKNITLLREHLLSIGESQMDLYTGTLPVADIAWQIIEQVKGVGLFTRNQFIEYLRLHPANYYTVPLSDGSLWVLRLGELENRYIHIHPGRYSLHTLRIKAGALKTAIATHVWMQLSEQNTISLNLLNQARKEILAASPVKSLESMVGFAKIYHLVVSP